MVQVAGEFELRSHKSEPGLLHLQLSAGGTGHSTQRAQLTPKKAEREPALTVDMALKSEATASRIRGHPPGSDLGCRRTSPPLPRLLVVAKLETRPEEWPGIW